jgi:hypothetical protein
MRRVRILKGVSFDTARRCVNQWSKHDLCVLNAVYGDDSYADAPVWPVNKGCIHMTRLAPSLLVHGPFGDFQTREILYEILEEAEPDKNYKEENTMTNAEMAKQIKEFAEKLDRYYENQEKMFKKYDDDINKLNNKQEELSEMVDGLGIVAQETTRQQKEQFAKIEQLDLTFKSLKVAITGTYGIPEEAKTLESMYPCMWKCEHRGKECNGQAQECPIAEHFSEQLKTSILGDKFTDVIKRIENDALRTEENKPLWAEDFSKFNAGKMAIVFDGDDPHFEATYMDFCRSIDEWCRTSEKNDKMYPQSTWTTRGFRMNPFMKCPSIYKDHSSFAVWIEWVDEKSEPTFEYGTLMTDWREHKTVGGLPYTVWKI